MIERIRIQNFRCLRDFEVKLGPLNFLVGANNTGKSSVLDALYVLGECMRRLPSQAMGRQLPSRLPHMRSGGSNQPVLIETHLSRPHDESETRSSASARRATYTLALLPKPAAAHPERHEIAIDEEALELSRAEKAPAVRYERERYPGNFYIVAGEEKKPQGAIESPYGTILWNLWSKGLRETAWVRKALLTTPRYSLVPERIRQPCELEPGTKMDADGHGLASFLDWLREVEPERFDRIRKTLGKLVGEVTNVTFPTVAKNRKAVLFWEKWGTKVPASEASDGLLLFLAILAIAYGHEEDVGVVLLEEPENGVHPERLRDIVRLLRAISRGELGLPPVQVVVTSHSPYLLDWCQKDEVIIFGRASDGNVCAKGLDELPDIDDRLRDYESLGAYVYEIAEPACESPS